MSVEYEADKDGDEEGNGTGTSRRGWKWTRLGLNAEEVV